MGRPAIRSGDIVSVNINGRGIAWCDGVFSGDAEIVAHARNSAETGERVYINGDFVVAGFDDAESAFAAIYSYNPDQAIVIEAPESTLSLASGAFYTDYEEGTE